MNSNKVIRFFSVTLFCLLIFGCTRDDLCPQGSADTPRLVIDFKDFNNQDNRKMVGLNVFVANQERTPVLHWTITDSIALPLNINSNRTDFIFEKYFFSGNDTLYWEDRINFRYDRKDIYVNRACGFRAEFFELSANQESNQWIQSILIKKDSVVDEKATHLTVFH